MDKKTNFFDRIPSGDKVTAFDMIFSQDATFGNLDDTTRSYTGSTQSDEFTGIEARYVRWDVTAGSGNLGISEMRFYIVPEPSSAAMLGLACLALIKRRRK